jgi:single-stranded-DNA-specific exonuclease
LTACADALAPHDEAGGMRVAAELFEHVGELRRRLNEYAAAVPCVGAPFTQGAEPPCLHVDLELPAADISLRLCEELRALEPFGAGWPCPVFATRDLSIEGEARVMKERHLKFNVRGADGRTHEAVWWGAAENQTATPRTGQRIELAYTVEANHWKGNTRLQLVVQDLRMVSGGS